MTWIRTHYDRVAVLAAALFLFASALLIIRKVAQFGENFAVLQAPPPPKPAAPPPRAVEMEQAMEKLRQLAQWTFSEEQIPAGTEQGSAGILVPPRTGLDFLQVRGKAQA